ncbi:hypothetical protein VP01_1527g1 [Puccinia sorghi]|uniref:DUF4219 domain-containing protein n=1 Tax=Puccinia sorghi TaxID=27349 RepID=A0A0L6VKG9_9BASI|nr:hypothetical protein VP01_1527g1 [Puccinia sorghi]
MEADEGAQRMSSNSTLAGIRMSSLSINNGSQQAVLKSGLDQIPQLTEENYSIWKDKMSALLKLQGVLEKFNAPKGVALDVDMDAELTFLLISKIDSVTHNNVVTADKRNSAKGLWKAIKDKFSSSQASNRARILNEFFYIKFKEESVETFITDVKVSIKKLVDELTVEFVCNHLNEYNNENKVL